MSNTKPKDSCALCDQPVEISGFTLTTNNGQEKFCCAGCLSIYQLLNDHKSMTKPSTNTEDNKK